MRSFGDVLMARRFRPRKEYRFWLYHDLAEDARIMEFIKYCKSTKQFAGVIRDGIRLIWSLREGNMAVLFELFPHLQPQFRPGGDELVEQFRQILLQQRPITIDSGVGQVTQKQLPPAAPPVIAPKAAPVADAGAIADAFLSFIQ
jgi:hypothetical protein